MSRLRLASKAPLAVAGILALPLFFVGLMAFTLRVDKPSTHIAKLGTHVLGDPTQGTIGTIYLLALAVSMGVVLVGVLGSMLRSRLAVIIPSAAGIVASVLLLLPLASWAAGHTSRYPLGVDNIPQSSPQDLSLRGEWEQGARAAAHQIGLVTIVMAVVAITLSVVFEIRRRRGNEGPAVPPPPGVVTGQPDLVGGATGETSV